VKFKFSLNSVKTLLLLVIVIVTSFNSFAQKNNLKKLHGTVLNADGYKPISNANVININSGFVAISNDEGVFEIQYNDFDSLKISSIGFETKYYVYPGKSNRDIYDFITLKTNIYNLPEVKIFPYKDYDEFKKAFVELDVKEQPTIDLHLPKDLQAMPTSGNGGLVISGAITALYNILSKQGRAYMHYLDVIEHEDYNRTLEKKYNVLVVKNVTGLIDDEETVKFMQFCKLPEEFVYKSNEYELYKAILDCYDSYLCENTCPENLK